MPHWRRDGQVSKLMSEFRFRRSLVLTSLQSILQDAEGLWSCCKSVYVLIGSCMHATIMVESAVPFKVFVLKFRIRLKTVCFVSTRDRPLSLICRFSPVSLQPRF